MATNKSLTITAEQFRAMVALLQQRPTELLMSPACRAYLAMERWTGAETVHGAHHEGVMEGTVRHNRRKTVDDVGGSKERTGRLISPLSALDPVFHRAAKLKVLSIGPRTEMEIFHLMAVGFQLENISALDLISTSPLIQTGDMHALPYPDRAFDVVISGWVLTYSREPRVAVDEMIRVCADGAFLAIGVTYEPGSDESGSDIVGSVFRSTKQLKSLLGNRFDRVLFEQEPDDDNKAPVMLIVRIRHGA